MSHERMQKRLVQTLQLLNRIILQIFPSWILDAKRGKNTGYKTPDRLIGEVATYADSIRMQLVSHRAGERLPLQKRMPTNRLPKPNPMMELMSPPLNLPSGVRCLSGMNLRGFGYFASSLIIVLRKVDYEKHSKV